MAASELLQILAPSARGACYLSHGGKLLGEANRSLAEYGIRDFETVDIHARCRGGGGDGGATGAESRDCYLTMYAEKKPDKVDPNEARLAKCTRCAFSSEPLKAPCVIDRLGSVYNKEAVVSALLDKEKKAGLPKHIRCLKDIIDVVLAAIPGVDDKDETKYQCPITGREFNGKFKFVALRGCGHVLSARAFEEIKSKTCLVCNAKFNEEDKLPLNGSAEEVEALRAKMNVTKKQKVKSCGAAVGGGVGGALEVKNGSAKRKEADGVSMCGEAARKKAKLPVPSYARPEVYNGLFTSSGKARNIRETYSCRALPIGRN